MKGLVLGIVMMILSNIYGQQFYSSGSGESTFLSEATAVIKYEKKKLFVDFAKSKKNENESLLKDDEILYLNGRKLKSLEDFQKAYAEIKEGEELKFGIKRNGENKIVSIKKGDTSGGSIKQQIKVSDAKEAEKLINDLKKTGNVKIIKQGIKSDTTKN